MDSQGRGRADDIDPADQWVLNPQTGDYELRLRPSAGQPPVPGPRRNPRGPQGPQGPRGSAPGGRGDVPPPRGGRRETRQGP
ncbi:LytR family transcriptional regulator, partial [Streptomyces sp. GXMU-J5]|nr:LytR family transcriptional regulator [Streptomyces beihaiensis]